MNDPAVFCVHQYAPGLEEREFTRPTDDEAFRGMDLSKCGDLLIIKADCQAAAHRLSCPGNMLLTDLVSTTCVCVLGGTFGQAYEVPEYATRSVGERIQARVGKQVSLARSMAENAAEELEPPRLGGVDSELVVGMIEEFTDTTVAPDDVSNRTNDDDSDITLLEGIDIVADERDELFGLRQAVKSIESQDDKML